MEAIVHSLRVNLSFVNNDVIELQDVDIARVVDGAVEVQMTEIVLKLADTDVELRNQVLDLRSTSLTRGVAGCGLVRAQCTQLTL